LFFKTKNLNKNTFEYLLLIPKGVIMKLTKKLLITNSILVIMTITSFSANAKLLFEPHLGFNSHGVGTKGTDVVTYNGTQVGARLGFQSFGIMGGLDYTHSIYTTTTTPPIGTSEKDAKTREELGAFVGYKLPVLLRAWVGYNFLAKEKQTSLGPTSGTKAGNYNKGHSTEIGVGFTGFPIVSINLSYKMLSYDKNFDPGANTTSAINPKYEPKEIVLGVSIPLNLP
jgi:hypothetical protein